MDRFLKGIFPPQRKIVTYNSKLILNLLIKDSPEGQNNKDDSTQGLKVTREEQAQRLAHMARKIMVYAKIRRDCISRYRREWA